MINNNCTCHGCHNICVFQLVFSIYIIYRLLKRVYCINIYTTSINRKILSSKKLKRTNKPQRIQATTMQSIFPFVFVFLENCFNYFLSCFFFLDFERERSIIEETGYLLWHDGAFFDGCTRSTHAVDRRPSHDLQKKKRYSKREMI